MTPRRVLVTGAGGFVGANLVRRLSVDGHHVVAAGGERASWRLETFAQDVRIEELDVRSPDGVASLVSDVRPEWIFHLAAFGAYSWQTERRRIFETNLEGTINVLEAAHRAGVEAVVGAGSSSEYGLKDHAPAETELLEPNSDYAVAKAAAGQFAAYFATSTDRRTTWLRLYSVYGPLEDPRRLVPRLVSYGLGGKLPPLASRATARDFVYVDDVCDAFLLAAARTSGPPAATYNVGTGVQTSLAELVEIAQRLLEVSDPPDWGSTPSRDWDTDRWIADPAKIERELGWRAGVRVEEGMRRTVEWLRAEPELLELYRRESTSDDPVAE